MGANRVLLESRLNHSFACTTALTAEELEIRPRPLIRGLVLSDCANTISLMYQDNPNTQNRSYKLVRNYLLDAQRFTNFSYVNAPYNLSDVGTKVNSNVAVWRRWAKSNCFYIGFMSRKEYKVSSEKMERRE